MDEATGGLDENDQARILAAVELVGRAGGTQFELAYDDDDPDDVIWWASAMFRGSKLFVDRRPSPMKAAEDLARRILTDAKCIHCQNTISLGTPTLDGCLWRRVGEHWVPGCRSGPLNWPEDTSIRLTDPETERIEATEMLKSRVGALRIRDYRSVVVAVAHRDHTVEPAIMVEMTGTVPNSPGVVTSVSLWSIDDLEAFAHMLLEQARIARQAGPPEEWPS